MKRKYQKFIRLIILTTIIVLGNVVVQSIVSGKTFSNDRLTVWVFDVGQGDAIFIDSPNKQILVDGGPSAKVLEKLSAVMPFWDRSIDLVINTHPHADHLTGLDYVLERYQVDDVWTTGAPYSTDVYTYFEELAPNEEHIKMGEEIDLGHGARLQILWPKDDLSGDYLEDPNEGSIVLLLTFNDSTILLTGDIGVAQEALIASDLPHIDVLKVGHHGSATSTGEILLNAITPDISIISVGENNDYGHPAPSTINRLKGFGSYILRTDLDGDIRIMSDGLEPEIATFDL